MEPAILFFDYAAYIANPQFSIYSNPLSYPEIKLQAYWDNATNYISNVGNFGAIQGTQREYAIQLMLSHLIFLANLIYLNNTATGTVPYQLQSATIDKVTITATPPPNPNQFQWWMGLSPFGQELLAMLQIQTSGGEYFGGSYVRAALTGTWQL